MLQHYLDTNTLYNLQQVPKELIADCYSSFLAVLEIISGVNERTYRQRRSAFRNIIELNLPIAWYTPDMIIFGSYNAYKEFDMTDSTVGTLQEAMKRCLECETFADFSSQTINDKNIVDHFKAIDQGITEKFTRSFPDLIQTIKKSALIHTFTQNEFSIKVDFTEVVKAGFISEKNYAMLVKQIAIGTQAIIKNSLAVDKPNCELSDVIQSYNGGVDFFICAWLRYSQNNIGIANLPDKNDFQDLLHCIYLRNSLDIKIVSDDLFYNKVAPKFHVTLQDLKSNQPLTKKSSS